jgi:hypothetical protein
VKSLLLTTAAIMIATSAHAWVPEDKCATVPAQQAKQDEPQTETIYVMPDTVCHWLTKQPVKTVINGDEKLLAVLPATNHDLFIAVKKPYGTVTAYANLTMIDEDGKLVQNLHVVVTPFGGPSPAVRIIQSGGNETTYLYANRDQIDANAPTSPKLASVMLLPIGVHAEPQYATHNGYPVRDGVVYPPKGIPYPAPVYNDVTHDSAQRGSKPYSAIEKKFQIAEAESNLLYDPATDTFVQRPEAMPVTAEMAEKAKQIEAKQAAERANLPHNRN